MYRIKRITPGGDLERGRIAPRPLFAMKMKVIVLIGTLVLVGKSGYCASTNPVEGEDGLPTSDSPESGSLDQNRIARDYSRTVCEMIMQGGVLQAIARAKRCSSGLRYHPGSSA